VKTVKSSFRGFKVKDELIFASAAVRANSKAFDNFEY